MLGPTLWKTANGPIEASTRLIDRAEYGESGMMYWLEGESWRLNT